MVSIKITYDDSNTTEINVKSFILAALTYNDKKVVTTSVYGSNYDLLALSKWLDYEIMSEIKERDTK